VAKTPGTAKPPRLRVLAEEHEALAARLRQGGGAKRVAKMHEKGQLAPRERVEALLDPGAPWFELGLLMAYDQYDGQAPGAGVITGVSVVEGREVVVVANDATVKAGSWWPETIRKMLRAQEVAMRQRIPIIYLVDSAGVNLPYQGGVFPGQYGAARIFYYNSLMRRYLNVPQISAVMGSCIAGGAYLPALSDVIFMVEGTSFMGLGGPNLVKGATGQVVDAETLGGAAMHTSVSAVAHYRAATDRECLTMIRGYVARLPRAAVPPPGEFAVDVFAWSALPATVAALGLTPFVLQQGTYSWLHAAVAGVLAFTAASIIFPFPNQAALPVLAFLAGLIAIGMRQLLITGRILLETPKS